MCHCHMQIKLFLSSRSMIHDMTTTTPCKTSEMALCCVMAHRVAQTLPVSPLSLDTDELLTLRLVSPALERHFQDVISPVLDQALAKVTHIQPEQLLAALRLMPWNRIRCTVDLCMSARDVKYRRLYVARCVYGAAQYYCAGQLLAMREQAAQAHSWRSVLQKLATTDPGEEHHALYEQVRETCGQLLYAMQEFSVHLVSMIDALCRSCSKYWRHGQLNSLVRTHEDMFHGSGDAQPPDAYLETLLKGPLMPLVLDPQHCWHKHVKQRVWGRPWIRSAMQRGFRSAIHPHLFDQDALSSLVHARYAFDGEHTLDKDVHAQTLCGELLCYTQLPMLTLRLLTLHDKLLTWCLNRWLVDNRVNQALATQLQTLLASLLSAQRFDAMCDLMGLRCAAKVLSLSLAWQCPLLCQALAQCPLSIVPRLAQWMPLDRPRELQVLCTASSRRLCLWLRHAPRGDGATHNSVHTLIRCVMARSWERECTLASWRRYLWLAARLRPPWPECPPVLPSATCVCGSPLSRCLSRLAAVLQQVWVPSELTLRVEAKQLHRQSVCEYLDEHPEIDDDGEALGHYDDDDDDKAMTCIETKGEEEV